MSYTPSQSRLPPYRPKIFNQILQTKYIFVNEPNSVNQFSWYIFDRTYQTKSKSLRLFLLLSLIFPYFYFYFFFSLDWAFPCDLLNATFVQNDISFLLTNNLIGNFVTPCVLPSLYHSGPLRQIFYNPRGRQHLSDAILFYLIVSDHPSCFNYFPITSVFLWLSDPFISSILPTPATYC